MSVSWSQTTRRLRALVALIASVLLASAVTASRAQAMENSFSPCDGGPLSQPFAPWGDFAWYELAPNGNFQNQNQSWTLNGGAQLAAGSEPYAATGSQGSRSLSLAPGASAESPLTAVDAAYPSIRFFIGGSGLVAAGLVYDGLYVPAGTAWATGAWTPSPVMITDSAIPGLLTGGCAPVAVRITGLSGNPLIDDVFVDPWNRG